MRLVEQGQQSRLQRQLGGEVNIDLAIARIAKRDFPYPNAAPLGEHLVRGDALIDRRRDIHVGLVPNPQHLAALARARRIPFRSLHTAEQRHISTAMSVTFATLVENVRSCSMEEKLELKSLLERSLIEERREEILADHRRSLAELKTRKPKFSSSISELKKSLAEK